MALFRAAFQYGIKMSEGRKTRRFKETNDKAELDRQWKKISAVSRLFLSFFLSFLLLFCFFEMVSVCSLGCPGTHSVDQAVLELRNLPASAS
jgi:hypothetical protein